MFGRKPLNPKMESLAQIPGAKPPCPEQIIKQSLQITDPKNAQAIAGWAGRLFGQQLEHTNRVIAFLRNRLLIVQPRRDPSGVMGQ